MGVAGKLAVWIIIRVCMLWWPSTQERWRGGVAGKLAAQVAVCAYMLWWLSTRERWRGGGHRAS